jgi:small subunit ribosomal protein S21
MYTERLDDSYLDYFGPVEVKVGDESIESAIRNFRQQVTKERIMSNLKEHAFFEKPSDKRRRKIRESWARTKKAASMKIKNGGNSEYDDDFDPTA